MSKLFDRIYGCEAACTIANAMGDITEGNTYKQIEEKWGFVETFMPQDIEGRVRPSDTTLGPPFITHAHRRVPGMTEDGMERHRLVTSAIIKKGGRITVWDLAEDVGHRDRSEQVRLPARPAGPGDLLRHQGRRSALGSGPLRRLARR